MSSHSLISNVELLEVMNLRPVLRWHGSHSADFNENINLGYSHDQGYS